ncbi:hypothetical protein TanjilG_22858 [Lupinus angustifolius]|uniref:Uncharacterized protein n=1 Tax=Lupinus angustifolius TaxID=3871 RepID=A0A4P1RIB8_LUPAN|nr:PREDICTED: acidic leucine-rich nuclear phosphoprotein 32 family member E-like [Lupinus angustifolius]OIW11051.1 hypothetical protein TanjilG_22858 [Lupinus angustifolius]
METPSSTRRVTRSQAWASSNSSNIPVSRKIEDSEKNHSISKERNNGCALMDITNDSPIVGLANGGNLDTPLSSMAKHGGSRMKKTPGSGEALLRGQVKNLLHKVEEEAVLSKISLESRPFLQLMNSPMVLAAPTPANTPQIANLSVGDSVSVTPSTIVQEQLIPQVLNHMFDGNNNGEDTESEKNVITRSLLLDFSEKSEISDASECFSELSYQEVVQGVDDDASIWSMQVNASTPDEDYDDDNVEDEIAEDEDDGDYYEDGEEEEGDAEDDGGSVLDELCEGLNNISVNEKVGPKFEGKHTRFLYNSDDEIVKEEEVENSVTASDVLHLKGIPTPKGKHLRFTEEEE